MNAKEHFERFTPAGERIEQRKALFRQHQFGGTLGGPRYEAYRVLAKADTRLHAQHQLSLRFNRADLLEENSEPWGGQVARSRGGSMMQLTSWADSWHRGSIVSLHKRRGARYRLLAVYTLSKRELHRRPRHIRRWGMRREIAVRNSRAARQSACAPPETPPGPES